jgi:hypothetical protein
MVSIHFKILALDYSITNKVIRYLLAKNQFSWCSLNPVRYLIKVMIWTRSRTDQDHDYGMVVTGYLFPPSHGVSIYHKT